jgi:predicted dehydrogenase
VTEMQQLGVGMVGYAFMGEAHAQAWRSANHFFDLPLQIDMAAVCGRDEGRVAAAADKLGWRTYETDWKALLARDDIDLIDVCTPGDTHAEIAIAALRAGKHVLCEKPLANTVAEAEAMTEAAATAREQGVRSMVGFTYRRVPAIALARQLVAHGRIGAVRHVRAAYLQDWITDPEAPLSWRLQKDKAGYGALGDIGSHIIDLTEYITGEYIRGVSGAMETFVKERPLPESSSGLSGVAGSERGAVTVDDAVIFLGRFSGGGLATFEATRFAAGRKNAIWIEINGSKGSLAFDFEDMNVLQYFDNTEDPITAGFRRILVTEPSHPYIDAWWPAGHGLGYEHGFTHQVVDLVKAIAAGEDPSPSFADGLRVQRVMAAVEASANARSSSTEVPNDKLHTDS